MGAPLYSGHVKSDAPRMLHVETITPIRVFPKIVVPQNGRFTMENPIKMDDLGAPPFLETPISGVFFTPGKAIYFRSFIGVK